MSVRMSVCPCSLGGPWARRPWASTCIPMAMGSLCYLLEGKVCALSGGTGTHVGAHQAPLAKEKLPLGYFYWVFLMGCLCVFASSAVSFRSGFRPKYLDFGVYLCKGGSPKANKSECLDCWNSHSCDEALLRVLYLLERGAQGPQMFTEMLGGGRMKVSIEGDTPCPHSSL